MATRRAVRKKKRFNLKRIINTFMFRSTFFDYSLLFIILFLVAFGLVIVYSTSCRLYCHADSCEYGLPCF